MYVLSKLGHVVSLCVYLFGDDKQQNTKRRHGCVYDGQRAKQSQVGAFTEEEAKTSSVHRAYPYALAHSSGGWWRLK